MSKVVLGFEVDREAIEPDEDHGVQGDPTRDVIYDHEGHGWHLASPHHWEPPGHPVEDP